MGDRLATLSPVILTRITGGLLGRLFSSYALIAMLVIGFAFIIIQGARRRLTYRMRLVSSLISLVIAAYMVGLSLVYIFTGIFTPLGLLGLFLAYRLVKTDIRTWRWFRERARPSDSQPIPGGKT